MEHEAEGHRQSHVEAPGDGSPVEQGIYGCPVLDAAHVGDVGLRGVEHPLAEGVEEDVRGQAGGEHHGSPFKIGILGFVQVAQADGAVPGKGHVQGAEEDAQADDQVVGSEGVPQKEADGFQGVGGCLRGGHEQDAEQYHTQEWNQGDGIVQTFRQHKQPPICSKILKSKLY